MGNQSPKHISKFIEKDCKLKSENDRWDVFIQSLDADPENVENINLLDQEQKHELLMNFESTNNQLSSFHCVTLIRELRLGKFNWRNKVQNNSDQVLRTTEVSLRTNSIEWVYDFLDNNGLEVLLEFMSQTLTVFINHRNKDSSSLTFLDSGDYQRSSRHGLRHSMLCINMVQPTVTVNECDKNSLHQALKCMKTIFNNKRGCEMALEHRSAINIITLCLLHPNYQTKTLVLEVLTVVCLIVNSIHKVLSSFDYFKKVTGESKRFEMLFMFFRKHETFNLDEYNVDFMISCMQFINIIVHSGKDINLRVYLQQEFTSLGLDDFYKKLYDKSGDRLKKQVEAYRDNYIDVAGLLEENGSNEITTSDIGRLKHKIYETHQKYNKKIIQYESKIVGLVRDISTIKTDIHSQQIEYSTLKIKILEPQPVTEHETSLQKRIVMLEDLLKEESIPSKASTDKDNYCSGTSSLAGTFPLTPQHSQLKIPPPPPPTPPPVAPSMSVGAQFPPAPPPVAPSITVDAQFPPAPPPVAPSLSAGAPFPPPPPGGLILENSYQSLAVRPPIHTNFKLPIFNWTVLQNQQLKGTVFVQMNDESLYNNLEFNHFEDLFKLNPVEVFQENGLESTDNFAESKNKKKLEKKSILDSNRHRCVAVLLRFLEQEKLNSDVLNKAINELKISLEVAERILYQVPSIDDVKLYQKYEYTDHLPIEALTDEDQLLLRLCKVERLSQKLEVVIYMENFVEIGNKLSEEVMIVTRASLQVRNSQKLKQILEIVLAYGNLMNSSRRGIMYGFRLQSLDLLNETRSIDKNWSLMQFYAFVIVEKFPELLDFIDEMKFVEQASKIPMESITSDVFCLVSGMKQVRDEILSSKSHPEKLRSFFNTYEQSTKELLTNSQNAKETFLQAAEWFGKRQNNPTPDQFFGIFFRFCDNFKKAIEDNAKRSKVIICTKNVKEASAIKPKDKKVVKETRKKNKRLFNRTSQINSDSIMDQILAGLGNEPMQNEIHTKCKNRV